MWGILIGIFSGIVFIGAIYLVWRIRRFSFLQKLGEKHRLLSWLAAALLLIAVSGLLSLINVPTMAVIVLHLIVAFLLCDFCALLFGKLTGRTVSRDLSGVLAVILCTVYLGIGTFLAWHIFETDYTFETKKEVGGGIRIVGIADAHLGVTVDGRRFAEQTERIRQMEPDIVVVAGDFVDGSSEREDMLSACRALGDLAESCEVFFISGNHDADNPERSFSWEELEQALMESGVRVLEDETVLTAKGILLTGRKDWEDQSRADMETLREGIDPSRYWVVIDHEPNDYAAEAESGADLVFSGHTHGGQIFPAGQIGMWIKANDRLYGSETRENTTFVVTSGISGWAIPIKTGTYSEIVVIDIRPAKDGQA